MNEQSRSDNPDANSLVSPEIATPDSLIVNVPTRKRQSGKKSWGKRLLRWSLGLLVLLAIAYGLVIHPFPYVIEMPGPTIDLLSNTTVQGKEKPIVEITDGKTHPRGDSAGEIHLVTVSLRGGPGTPSVRGWELIWAYFDSSQHITPYSQVFPPDVTAAQEQKVQKQFMTASQDNARAAALTALHIPFSSTIKLAQISEKSDGYNKLKVDDLVKAISKDGNRQEVKSTADLYRILESTNPGTPITVTVERASKMVDINMKTIDAGPGRKGSLLGAYIQADYKFPYPIKINIPETIGGPSAGTAFALSMMNNLTGGKYDPAESVAVTGTMSPNGQVGPIGGVVQKIYGAQRDGVKWFLAPDLNCDELAKQKLPEGITPVRISTLSDAAQVLQDIKTHNTKDLPVCKHL